MPPYKRLDQILVERGLFSSRQKASCAIRSGDIVVNNTLIDKPGKSIPANACIKVKKKRSYVSRGGIKLQAAIKEFDVKVQDKIALDIGCSTGGFTDCLLQNGAKLIYAVDVGYGQLAWPLRNNPKVVLMERRNARYLKPKDFPHIPQLVTIDVSFISLDKIIPVVSRLILSGGEVIALIKPQFEAGPKRVKHGVVKDPQIHREVIKRIEGIALYNHLQPKGVLPSPLLGPAGNKEFLLYLLKT